MLLTRTFAQRRMTMLGVAGALLLGTFFVLPQGQAFAASLLLFFRGQTIQPIATDYAHLQNAYKTLEELEKLGSLQGTIPSKLNTVSSISAAQSMAGFTPAQPGTFPTGIGHTPAGIKALAPTSVTLTLHKTTADAYFKTIGSNRTLPAAYDGEQLIVNFPGVSLLEYVGSQGGGKLFVGQAGQLVVNASGNATVTQLRDYFLTLPGLSSDTANTLKNISTWQTTIPLGIPTDRVGWQTASVGGTFAGSGVILNDNTGIGSAVVWQTPPTNNQNSNSNSNQANGSQSLGVGGWGLKASDVQAVAGSLH
jgi:hypothetical protein